MNDFYFLKLSITFFKTVCRISNLITHKLFEVFTIDSINSPMKSIEEFFKIKTINDEKHVQNCNYLFYGNKFYAGSAAAAA